MARSLPGAGEDFILTEMSKKLPDPHFGSDEEMTAWAEREGLEIVIDEEGNPDWHAVWKAYLEREEGSDS